MKVVVAGGSGFIGKRLVSLLLEKEHEVIILTRNASGKLPVGRARLAEWDGMSLGSWVSEVDGAGAIINFSGESVVSGRWTKERKEKIRGSRINSTRVLVEAIRKAVRKPAVLVNASAVGFYGNIEAGQVDESAPKGRDFLADTCAEWEAEAKKAEAEGVRTVIVRIGVVLSKEGGALQKMIPPFTFFAGGPLGPGKQAFPWIHIDDLAGIFLFAIRNTRLQGVVNGTAPNPVTMAEFSSALGRAMKRPSWAPVPAFVLKLLLGEMSHMLLTGQRAIPKKLKETGYVFTYPAIDRALQNIFVKK